MDALEIAEQLNQEFIPVSRDDKVSHCIDRCLAVYSSIDALSVMAACGVCCYVGSSRFRESASATVTSSWSGSVRNSMPL